MDKKKLGSILLFIGLLLLAFYTSYKVVSHYQTLSYMEGVYTALGDEICEYYDIGPLNNHYCDVSEIEGNYTTLLNCSWIKLMINTTEPRESILDRLNFMRLRCNLEDQYERT